MTPFAKFPSATAAAGGFRHHPGPVALANRGPVTRMDNFSTTGTPPGNVIGTGVGSGDPLSGIFPVGGSPYKPEPLSPEARSQAINGMVGRDGLLLPQYRTFSAVWNQFSRLYPYRYDEAVRAGREQARAMARDAFFRALLDERRLPLTKWKWEIESDPDDLPREIARNPKDPRSVEREAIRRQLEAIIRRTPDLLQMRQFLSLDTWFGRYGAQGVWAPRTVQGYERLVFSGNVQDENKGPIPVEGDKIYYDWDGDPGVMIWAADRTRYTGYDVRFSDSAAPVLMLSTKGLRQRFILGKFMVEDADYFEPMAAGRVHGVGLRDFSYWAWWLRDEMISWITDFMEKVGSMGLILFYYEEGNPESLAAADHSARAVNTKFAFAVPRPRSKDPQTSAVEQVSPQMAGVEFLIKVIADWFERHIERLFVGQSMSSGADNESGMGGSGRAKFAQDTLFTRLAFDAGRHADMYTTQFVQVARDLNFPGCPYRYRWRFRLPDPEAKEKLDAMSTMAKYLTFRSDDAYELIGATRPDEGDDVFGGPGSDQPGGAGGAPGMPPGSGSPPGTPGQPQPGQPGPGAPDEPAPTGPNPAGNQPALEASATPGMAEVVKAMMEAAAAGDGRAVDRLVRLGQNQEELSALVGDSGEEPAGGEQEYVTYVDDAGIVQYEWVAARTQHGHIKAEWTGPGTRRPLYGQRASAALAAQFRRERAEKAPPVEPNGPQQTAKKPQDRAKELAAGREPAREAARQAYRKALENPGSLHPSELPALAQHLHSLTRDEIRTTLAQQGQKTFGAVKQELVDRLLAYVRTEENFLEGTTEVERQGVPETRGVAPEDLTPSLQREAWAAAREQELPSAGREKAAGRKIEREQGVDLGGPVAEPQPVPSAAPVAPQASQPPESPEPTTPLTLGGMRSAQAAEKAETQAETRRTEQVREEQPEEQQRLLRQRAEQMAVGVESMEGLPEERRRGFAERIRGATTPEEQAAAHREALSELERVQERPKQPPTPAMQTTPQQQPQPDQATGERDAVRKAIAEKRPPFPVDETGAPSGLGRAFPPGPKMGAVPVTPVKVANLTATQTFLKPETIAHLESTNDQSPIFVVRANGKEYIYDGTHRATVAKLKGEETIPAKVFDFVDGKFVPVVGEPVAATRAEEPTQRQPEEKPSASPLPPEETARLTQTRGYFAKNLAAAEEELARAFPEAARTGQRPTHAKGYDDRKRVVDEYRRQIEEIDRKLSGNG